MSEEFKEIVRSLGLSYCPGLQAFIGQDGKRITVQDSKKLAGSVPLDEDLKDCFPNENRWDYVVGYVSESKSLFFIEIHPAGSDSKATEVLKKKKWLAGWLATEGQKLKTFAHVSRTRFCWIATKNVPPLGSKIYKTMAKNGIRGPLSALEIKEL